MTYECWVWVVKEQDGTEHPIATILPQAPQLGPMVLQHSTKATAQSLEQFARAHGKASGRPVRLAHLVEDYETPRLAPGHAQDTPASHKTPLDPP